MRKTYLETLNFIANESPTPIPLTVMWSNNEIEGERLHAMVIYHDKGEKEYDNYGYRDSIKVDCSVGTLDVREILAKRYLNNLYE